jgi:YHS domain-containing protein
MAIRRFAVLLAAAVPAALCASLLTAAAPAAKTERIGEPYTLSTCPVSGENLGSMGDAIVKVYDGREVRFCCDSCVVAYEKDPAKYLAKIDEMIVAQQMPFYPLTNCVVNPGDPLDIEGAHDVSVRYIYYNRLVRFCCDGCTGKFEKNPEKFLAVIDEAVIEQQSKDYPLTTCVISGEKLGGMGKTIDKVYANRLVRLCCAGCVEEFESDPVKYFRQIDAARSR